MGYRITYENDVIRKSVLRIPCLRWRRWGIGLGAAALAVSLLIPGGRLWLRDLLLPGDEEITASALESMIADLRSGEPVGEAVEAFCKEIISGGT